MKLSAIILTRNESANLEECLAHLGFADEVVIVDSSSTDETIDIAKRHGCIILQRPLDDFSAQRNFAMQHAKGDWILFVDADERVTQALAAEISQCLEDAAFAYRLPRLNFFFKKPLRFSGVTSDAPLRLFPRGSGSWVQPVHEYFKTDLPVKQCRSHLDHHTTRDLKHYMRKLGHYIPLEIDTMRSKKRKVSFLDVLLRAPVKFFYLYVFKLGFLDGWVGLQFAALSSYYDYKKWSLYRAAVKLENF